MNTTKTLRFGIALLLILATLSQLFIFASADNSWDEYLSYRPKVESIDNSRLRNTEQLHRLDKNYKRKKGGGMCNLCSLEILLNRRVAYDFGDYSSPFDDYDMFDAIDVDDLGGGKKILKDGTHGYYLSDGVASAQDGTLYPYNSSVTYQPVLLGNAAVTKLIKPYGDGLNAQYQAIAALLREHPEGIWLRAEYRTHAIVITDYTDNNGEIQLYGIDPVNVRDNGWGRKEIQYLHFFKNNYKNGMISDKDPKTGNYRINIAYLVQTAGSPTTHPAAPAYDAPASAPVISISGQNLPDYQTVGDNFGIRGTVYTDCGTITYLRGSIMDSAGNEVQLGQYYPSASSVDLRYTLNNDLVFGYLPAGQYTYCVMATAKNGSEETTQELIRQSFTVGSPDMPETPTYDAPASAPVISISGQNLPEYQTVGDNFGIRGTVYTDCGTITYLRGSIMDSAGNEVQLGQYYPSASSVDLRYTLNNDLVFGYLPAGQYTYYVTATAQNGGEETTQELIRQSFTVGSPDMPETPTYDAPASAPVISISGQNLPEYQTVGDNFGIRGTVYTDCGTITYLRGSIMDSAGNEVQVGQYYPSASSVDLRYTLNNDLIFGYLPAGVYTYYVQAKAENNGQETVTTLIEHVFTVEGAGESTQAEPELNPVGYNMTVNVGAGSTLRFCSTVSIADQYELGSLPNGAVVYVYGTTQQQYEDRTWAKISYNGADGWVNYKWLS